MGCTILSATFSSEAGLLVAFFFCSSYQDFLSRRNVEKRSLLDRMDALMLILDELVDGG